MDNIKDYEQEAKNLVTDFVEMKVTINTKLDSIPTRVTDQLALNSAKELAAKQVESWIAIYNTLPTKHIARTISSSLEDCKRILFHIKNIKSL